MDLLDAASLWAEMYLEVRLIVYIWISSYSMKIGPTLRSGVVVLLLLLLLLLIIINHYCSFKMK